MHDTASLVSQFFLLSLLNRDQALHLSQKILQKNRISELTAEQSVQLLGDCYRCLHDFLGANARMKSEKEDLIEFIDFSDTEIEIRGWQEFLKKATIEEIGAILACHIFGFNEEQTCQAFRISAGTLKYRLSRGFRKLGRVLGGQTIKLVTA